MFQIWSTAVFQKLSQWSCRSNQVIDPLSIIHCSIRQRSDFEWATGQLQSDPSSSYSMNWSKVTLKMEPKFEIPHGQSLYSCIAVFHHEISFETFSCYHRPYKAQSVLHDHSVHCPILTEYSGHQSECFSGTFVFCLKCHFSFSFKSQVVIHNNR